MVEILERRTLYRDPAFYSAFPALTVTLRGEIVLAFRRAPDDRALIPGGASGTAGLVDHVHARSHIALCRFAADLSAVGDVQALPGHPLAADQDANLITLSSGRLLLSSFLWRPVPEGVHDYAKEIKTRIFASRGGRTFVPWGAVTRLSDDDGATWSNYRELPDPPWHTKERLAGQPADVAARGRPVEWGDRVLIPAYTGHHPANGTTALIVYESKDGGESFALSGLAGGLGGTALYEPALFGWQNALHTASRTSDKDDRMAIFALQESGYTGGRLSDVRGHPVDPLALSDGRLLLVYGYRHEAPGIRARVLAPGDSPESAEEWVLDDTSPGADCGYPWSVKLEDETILTAYYRAEEDGVRGIEGVRYRL